MKDMIAQTRAGTRGRSGNLATTMKHRGIERYEFVTNVADDRHKHERTLIILQSFRQIYPGYDDSRLPHASDVYHAHLAEYEKRVCGIDQELAKKLPDVIQREAIIETDDPRPGRKYLLELFDKYQKNIQNAHIKLNREDPEAESNKDIYKVLTEEIHGKSSCHLMNDANTLLGTKKVLDDIIIHIEDDINDYGQREKKLSMRLRFTDTPGSKRRCNVS